LAQKIIVIINDTEAGKEVAAVATACRLINTVGWVISLAKTVPEMTYNVFSGTLLTHSLTHTHVG